MNCLEEELKKNKFFPRIWYRYVDDVIAVVENDKVDQVLSLINDICPHIQFTVEYESDRRLPFLDLMLERGEGGDITFDII